MVKRPKKSGRNRPRNSSDTNKISALSPYLQNPVNYKQRGALFTNSSIVKIKQKNQPAPDLLVEAVELLRKHSQVRAIVDSL